MFFFKAIELVGQLTNFSESDTTVLVDWMLTNKVTLGTLATYADPDEVSRKEHLPRGPFVALVKKLKENQLVKGTCELTMTIPPKKCSLTTTPPFSQISQAFSGHNSVRGNIVGRQA